MMDFLQNICVPFAITMAFTFFIGLERQNVGKSAGISAHVLIALAACAIALLQLELFDKEVETGNNNPESQRVIAQVITGVGFIGAGVILKTNDKITGLTTAATLFGSAMLGLIIGMGYYKIGIVFGGIIVLFMYLRDIKRHFNPFVSHREEDNNDGDH